MKHLKIMSVLMSAAIATSMVATPVSVIADETETTAEITEGTEAPDSKETEAPKETKKKTETAKETEPPKESVPPYPCPCLS